MVGDTNTREGTVKPTLKPKQMNSTLRLREIACRRSTADQEGKRKKVSNELTPWYDGLALWNGCLPKRLAGIFFTTSVGLTSKSHNLSGDEAPPGNRQLVPIIAIGSSASFDMV